MHRLDPRARAVVSVVLGVLAITAGAQVAFTLPGGAVPQTGQTLAVLAVAVVLGPERGTIAVLVYLILGALDMPVFARFGSGLERLTGPAGGFLLAFLPAAWLVGVWTRAGRARRFWTALAVMSVAHVLILAAGWSRLTLAIGAGDAFARGVQPFLLGGFLKSAVAAFLAVRVGAGREGSPREEGELSRGT